MFPETRMAYGLARITRWILKLKYRYYLIPALKYQTLPVLAMIVIMKDQITLLGTSNNSARNVEAQLRQLVTGNRQSGSLHLCIKG